MHIKNKFPFFQTLSHLLFPVQSLFHLNPIIYFQIHNVLISDTHSPLPSSLHYSSVQALISSTTAIQTFLFSISCFQLMVFFPLISHPINTMLPEVDINWSSTVVQCMSIMILNCLGPTWCFWNYLIIIILVFSQNSGSWTEVWWNQNMVWRKWASVYNKTDLTTCLFILIWPP